MTDTATPHLPLRAVVRRTGLKADLIRAWERRYSAIAPARSPSNQRIFSEQDVERLLLLRDAVGSGLSISRIAELGNDEIASLIRPALDLPASVGLEVNPSASPTDGAVAAIRALDADRLRQLLDREMLDRGRVDFLEGFLVPVMREVGRQYEVGQLRIVHEHLASATIRSVLETLRPAFPPNGGSKLIVVGTPSGQHHEIAALLVAAAARMEGCKVTYLGSNLPAEELAAAGRETGAEAIALSITVSGDKSLPNELRRLRKRFSGSLLIGGRAVSEYRPVLREIEAHELESFSDLRRLLSDVQAGPT